VNPILETPIALPTGGKAELARRLFANIARNGTDLADGIMEIDVEEYRDAELARRERREVFGRVPIVAAHGSELPAVNDFRRVQLPNNEALLVRQADGSVRAFVNVCRHRGARLAGEDCGGKKLFTCIYHGWSYRPDGSLAHVSFPETFGDLDRSGYGLIELPCQLRHGLVWVTDRVGAVCDPRDWLGAELDDTFTEYGLDRYRCFRLGSFDEEINWKVLMDAFLDNYHIATTHANSVGPYFYSNVQIVDGIGRHCRAISPRRSIDKILHEPVESAPIERHVTIGYSMMPNLVLLRQPDHFQLLSFLPHPSGPARSRMEIRMIVPEASDRTSDTDEIAARWEKNWTILMNVLRDEDMALNRDLQVALGSADGPHRLLIGRNEVVNQRFHRWLDAALQGNLG
jgi:phenylpropionate dioxygenase-like ring-hydroxylating dioxygenase large terminal subunit